MRVLVFLEVLLLTLTGACMVPHSARVEPGGYASASIGGGPAMLAECPTDCWDHDYVPVARPAAQVSAGYGWRSPEHAVLTYVAVPLASARTSSTYAPDDLTEGAMHVLLTALGGTSAGAYMELEPDDPDRARGIGVMVNLATVVEAVDAGAYPSLQGYAMIGQRAGGVWIDAGLRAGVVALESTGADYGAGGWVAVRRDAARSRTGLFLDVSATTQINLHLDDNHRYVPVVVAAGLLIETR